MALGIAIGAWLASIALNIRDLIILRSQFDRQERICSLPATNRSLANVIGILASDLVLLTTMLIGLLRYREGCFGRFGLWRLLFQQGLMWFVLATVAEVPNVVLASINLNEVWDVVFQPVTLVILAIGSTRMYRYLSEYSSITVFKRPAGDSAARMTPDDAADAIPMDIHLEIEREEACTLGKKAHVLA
ncbi:hypothetical protein BV25DRAFT_1467476 [Artomyces pyxidatus]|uniref:Uncharacterized protein n=1 Tax=Artomyces pyxidatus TaxID=48021 RepID=A0ACB8SMQ6_9AGAM|nr:hypothetical protein BV25DRAFT_1467476 [Artomyces pyxidatus]